MKPDQRGLSIGIGVFLIVIFFVDIRMGLGFTPWLLYVIPLGLTYWTSRAAAPLIVAALCSILTMIGYALSPPLIPEYIALTNRTMGIVMFWALACLVAAYQLLARRLSQLTIELKQELVERTQDLGRAVNALRAMANQGIQSGLQAPVTAIQLKRQVADVLMAESRRLHEQAVQLEQVQASEDGNKENWEDTRRELERLSRQLEQLQRELLHP